MSMHEITPTPSDEEAAAIIAAVDAAWPRAVVDGGRETAPRWRWSGRWWTKPGIERRDRP